MMDDLIKRKDAIDICKSRCEACGEYKKYNGVMCGSCYLDGVADDIECLPSAQQWIPVNERLPEDTTRAFVTRHDYVTDTDFVDILWYENGVWWNRKFGGDYAVIAWMPLPQPYKEVNNE